MFLVAFFLSWSSSVVFRVSTSHPRGRFFLLSFFFLSFSISISISRIFRFLALIEVLCVRGFQNMHIQSLD